MNTLEENVLTVRFIPEWVISFYFAVVVVMVVVIAAAVVVVAVVADVNVVVVFDVVVVVDTCGKPQDEWDGWQQDVRVISMKIIS